MQAQDIKVLLEKYKAGTITDAEKAVLDQWYLQVAVDSSEELTEEERLETFDQVLANLNEVVYAKKARRLWPRIAAAAALILSIGGVCYFLRPQPVQQIAQNRSNDLLPGGNKAVLTLSNGQKIVLTGAKNGQLTTQGQTIINKTADGRVSYEGTSAEVVYNTMTTPKGGQYQLTLADGTVAYLDAVSSIKYPVSFGKERTVEITGQVYFEVVHDASKPFKVIAKGQTIEDIGTHFNVNAYDDEPVVKTTLSEGIVKVNNQLLRPGQAAVTANDQTRIKDADVEQDLAWKNGAFDFNHTDIRIVMRQIARWYNVEVIYEGEIPATTITGKVYRNTNASKALKIIKLLGINYKIQGHQIIISKN
jgi:transmembrane sensor